MKAKKRKRPQKRVLIPDVPTTWGKDHVMMRLGDLDSYLKEQAEEVFVKLQLSCYPVWVEVTVEEMRGIIRVVSDPDVTVVCRLQGAGDRVLVGW